MKSIGLSDEVYADLLKVKHQYETIEERVISYDDIIKKLIALNNYQNKGEKQGGGES